MLRNTFQSPPLSIFYSIGSHQLELWQSCKSLDDDSIEFLTDEIVEGKVLQLKSEDITSCYIRSCLLGIKSSLLVLILRRISTVQPFSFEVEVVDQNEHSHILRFSTFEEKARFAPHFAAIPLEFEDRKFLEQHEKQQKQQDQEQEKHRNMMSGVIIQASDSSFQSFQTSSNNNSSYNNNNTVVFDPDKEAICQWCQIVVNLEFWTRKAFGNHRSYKFTKIVQIHSSCRLQRVYFTDQNTQAAPIPAEFKLFISKLKKN